MAWAVDTCVLIDIAVDDPAFGRRSADCLERRMQDGLVICPVTFVELGPVFGGDRQAQTEFLGETGIDWTQPWTPRDTDEANRLWSGFVLGRRSIGAKRRPVADVLIAGFASRFQGLITRNTSDFRTLCPELRLLHP
jgi:predicted nucleic acid-binding protein